MTPPATELPASSAGPRTEAAAGLASPHVRRLSLSDWGAILRRTASEFIEDDVMAVSGGVSFYALLSLVPAIAAFVSLYGLFADVGSAIDHIDALGTMLPRDAFALVTEQVTRIAGQPAGKLSAALAVSIAVSLWSANAAMKALIGGLNRVKEAKEVRGFVRLNLVSLGFTAGAIVFLMIALAGVVMVPAVFAAVGYTRSGDAILAALRWPVLFAVLVGGLALVYRYAPTPPRSTAPRWFTAGGLLAAILWIGASAGFSAYVSSFGAYNETYGSLAAVVIFMSWIWISTMVVLLGAELDREIARYRAH